MVEDHILEAGGEMDLAGAVLGEIAEGVFRQRRRAVLHRPAHPIALAGRLRQRLQRVQVELHLRDAAVRQHYPAMRGARLDRNLAQAYVLGAHLLERAVIAVHVGFELFHRAVLAPHLADLAADGHRHVIRLVIADVRRELGRADVVLPLLLVQGRVGEIHQGGGIDVDVEEARGQSLVDQHPDGLQLLVGAGLVFRRVRLEVIALDEHRMPIALPECRAEDHGGVLRRPLLGVGDFAARDLEDQGGGLPLEGGAERRAGGMVGKHPQVHRRHGEGFQLAAPAGQVELMDGRWSATGFLRQLPDQPPRRVTLGLRLSEYRRFHEAIHRFRGERGLAKHFHRVTFVADRATEQLGHGPDRVFHQFSLRKTLMTIDGRRKISPRPRSRQNVSVRPSYAGSTPAGSRATSAA